MKTVLDSIDQYYTGKILAHGPSPRGVDWNSEISQQLRFAQLLKIHSTPTSERATLLDYGCGYGALLEYLKVQNVDLDYFGFDISKLMIEAAHAKYQVDSNRFVSDHNALKSDFDYVVASGLFNVRLQNSNEEWTDFIVDTLEQMNEKAKVGFSFNFLTSYCDAEKMRPDLYYGNPEYFFKLCVQKFSRWVSVLHDYPLYEFTILVRKTI